MITLADCPVNKIHSLGSEKSVAYKSTNHWRAAADVNQGKTLEIKTIVKCPEAKT
ncbi:MAG: hypothetical protein WCS94_21645 [Verrucomicrobiota bacterium]